MRNIHKLQDFAKLNHLKLSAIDDEEDNFSFPGKRLNAAEIFRLIEDSRKSGIINMDDAHAVIRKKITASTHFK
jgi:methyl coenzyme M reductase alpha subunit